MYECYKKGMRSHMSNVNHSPFTYWLTLVIHILRDRLSLIRSSTSENHCTSCDNRVEVSSHAHKIDFSQVYVYRNINTDLVTYK